MPDLVPVSEAAKLLGVNRQRVRAMIAAGELPASKAAGVWWIDRHDLARRGRAGTATGRPLDEKTAWGMLLMAGGERAPWLSTKARWRVAKALREQGLALMAPRLRRRASVQRWQAHPSELARLRDRDDVMLTGPSAAHHHRLGLHGGQDVELYVPASLVAVLCDEHALERDGEPNIILRMVSDDLWQCIARPVAPRAAVLLDLSESDEPRARRVGSVELGHQSGPERFDDG